MHILVNYGKFILELYKQNLSYFITFLIFMA